jgi:hypothetical protein
MNRPTSKQYLAKAFEYGDWAKTSVGSARRHEFRELEARFSVLAVLADNDELLREENAVCRTQQDDTNRTTLASEERWSRVTGQNGGLAKVDSGFDYAANFCSLACVA